MAARKKTPAKKSAPKKASVKKTASRKVNHHKLDEKNQLIIVGGVVAIILFILGSVLLEKSKTDNVPQVEYAPIEAPSVGTESAQ